MQHLKDTTNVTKQTKPHGAILLCDEKLILVSEKELGDKIITETNQKDDITNKENLTDIEEDVDEESKKDAGSLYDQLFTQVLLSDPITDPKNKEKFP